MYALFAYLLICLFACLCCVVLQGLQEHMMYSLTYPNAALQMDHDEDEFRRGIAAALVESEVLDSPGGDVSKDDLVSSMSSEQHADESLFVFQSQLPSPPAPSTSTSTSSAPRPTHVREISESVLDLNFTFENQDIEVDDPDPEDSSFDDSTIADKDKGLSSTQAHKVVHSELVAIGKQLRTLEQESKRAQEVSLKAWQKAEAPRLKEEIKNLEKKVEALRKEQKSALKNKTGFHSQLDETITALVAEQDALKLKMYFPGGPPVSFGSGGVYFAMDYIWLENVAGKFHLKLSSCTFGAQLLFALQGAGDEEGMVVDVTIGGFKLKSENKGIPSLTLDSVNIRVSLKVELLLSFFAGKQQWESTPEQFVVQLLSFKGPFGISRGMVSALLSIAVPVIKLQVLEMLPIELGIFVSETMIPLDLAGSFQIDGSVVVSELFHGMQKSATVCNTIGYNAEQMLNFLALQKSLERKSNIKSVVDLLHYRNDHWKQAQWDGIVRLWDQAAIIYHQARMSNQGLLREGEIRMSEIQFETEDDEIMEYASSAFLSFEKLLLGVEEIEKNPLSVRFSLDTFRLDLSVTLMLRRAEEYYSRVAKELVAKEASGNTVTKATKLYVEKMKQMCIDSQQSVTSLGQLIHNLQFIFRMHVTSGIDGDVSWVAKDVYTQFPISFNVHMDPDSDSVFSPIVPTIKNMRTKEDGFVSIKLFHLGSEEMLKKANFLAFKNKARLDEVLNAERPPVIDKIDSNLEVRNLEDPRGVQKRVLEKFISHCDRQNTTTKEVLAIRPGKMSSIKLATLNIIRPRMSFIVNDLVTLQPGTALFIVQVGEDDGIAKIQDQNNDQVVARSKEVVKKYNKRRSTLLEVVEAVSSYVSQGENSKDLEDYLKEQDEDEEQEEAEAEQELTVKEKGTPISMQGTNGLRTEAHIPEMQFQGNIPRLLQFIARHGDDIQMMSDFFDETLKDSTNRAAVLNRFLEFIGKYLLLPNFELLLNLGVSVTSSQVDGVSVVCTTNKKYLHVFNLFLKVDFMDFLNDWNALLKTVVESE